jgi:hypothetical protein
MGESRRMKLDAPIRKVRVYEKYSWVLLMIGPLLIAVLNIQGLFYGYSSDAPSNLLSGAVTSSTPAATVNLLNYIARGGSAGSLLVMLLVLAIAATAYRKEERWALYIEAYVFVGAVAILFMETTEGQNNLLGVLILGVPWLLGLILPYRKFFPSKRPGRSHLGTHVFEPW